MIVVMAKLLRNQTGLNNPEAYLNRLEHFSHGLGVSLHIPTRAHDVTNKQLSMTSVRGALTGPSLSFGVHNEGSMLPSGVMDIAISDAISHRASRDVLREINHRRPASVDIYTDDNDDKAIQGQIIKYHYDPDTIGNKIQQSTAGYFTRLPDYKNILMDVEGAFNKINRNRRVDPDNSTAVTHILNNPNPVLTNTYHRSRPETLSSQFVRVDVHNKETGDKYAYLGNDVIDLKTGKWAELDPNGYFPD